MSPAMKFLIGLAAILLMGWAYHGPLVGNGEATVARLEQAAQAVVSDAAVPGVEVRMHRDPLARAAILSGPANSFQREGMGQYPGLTDRVAAIDGISSVGWADEGDRGGGIPLLVETFLMLVIAYLVGVGLAWLLFGRPKKESYL